MSQSNQEPKHGSKFYDDSFYETQLTESYASAKIYSQHLAEVYRPKSVADFGCGRGPWLKAFKELGAERVVGFDGPWNRQENMIDPAIEFNPVDLNDAVVSGLANERFDLAMTLEVVEHLIPDRSASAVKALCNLADVVMFGAAFLHQPGTDHINTRLHSFWAELFVENDYAVYDYFRPTMWGRQDVPYWYQQNTFLYVKNGHPVQTSLEKAGHQPIKKLELLDAVHPELFLLLAEESGISKADREIREKLKGALPKEVVKIIQGAKSTLRGSKH